MRVTQVVFSFVQRFLYAMVCVCVFYNNNYRACVNFVLSKIKLFPSHVRIQHATLMLQHITLTVIIDCTIRFVNFFFFFSTLN